MALVPGYKPLNNKARQYYDPSGKIVSRASYLRVQRLYEKGIEVTPTQYAKLNKEQGNLARNRRYEDAAKSYAKKNSITSKQAKKEPAFKLLYKLIDYKGSDPEKLSLKRLAEKQFANEKTPDWLYRSS